MYLYLNTLDGNSRVIKNASSFDFLREVDRCLTASSGDLRETSFLFQHLSILIQRFNDSGIFHFY